MPLHSETCATLESQKGEKVERVMMCQFTGNPSEPKISESLIHATQTWLMTVTKGMWV